MCPQPRTTIAALNSWKEISAYMGRGIRTIQRWEREFGLPVHRVGHGPRSPVHAFPLELNAWLMRVDRRRNGNRAIHPQPRLHPDGQSAISRVLVQRSSGLVEQIVQSLSLQRVHTEKLLKSLDAMRRQMRRRDPVRDFARDGTGIGGDSDGLDFARKTRRSKKKG